LKEEYNVLAIQFDSEARRVENERLKKKKENHDFVLNTFSLGKTIFDIIKYFKYRRPE